MKLEEVKKELQKVFGNIEFFEDTHTYEINGKKVGISATRLIEEYSQPFEKDLIAQKVAVRDNKEVYEVLEEWEAKNRFACDKGHICHEYAQKLWAGTFTLEEDLQASDTLKNACERIFRQAKEFFDNFKGFFTHIQYEQLVGSEEYDIASAVDHLFLDEKGRIWLIDYKTNSILKGYNDDEKNRRYTKNMKVPLQEIKDDALHHYYLQLSLYKYLIEKYTKLTIYKCLIVYMSENIEKYECIEVPYLEKEVKKILENRRKRKMGKCIPILIIGKSGAGKSASLRNLKKEEYSIVNPLAKRLPFKGGAMGLESANYEEIKNFIAKTPKDIVVIDDSNYLLTVELMRKAKESGYNKFTDIALDYWNLIDFIKNLDGDKRVYLMSHEEIDEFGNIGVKTVGKMLNNQCCVEGLYTIVLRATNENQEFKFRVKSAGNDIVKAPIGLFKTEFIDNDLKEVDKAICEYYEIKKEEDKKDVENKD